MGSFSSFEQAFDSHARAVLPPAHRAGTAAHSRSGGPEPAEGKRSAHGCALGVVRGVTANQMMRIGTGSGILPTLFPTRK